jgi:hypothetical protein
LEQIWRDTEDLAVDLYLERIAQPLAVEQKQVLVQLPDEQRRQTTDNEEIVFSYDRLLLATGGNPRRLPFGDDQIIYYRTLQDYHHLRVLTEERDRFAIIGGGFIGSELAAALAMNDKEVVMIFPEKGIVTVISSLILTFVAANTLADWAWRLLLLFAGLAILRKFFEGKKARLSELRMPHHRQANGQRGQEGADSCKQDANFHRLLPGNQIGGQVFENFLKLTRALG